MRHGSDRLPGAEVIQTAHRAVALADAANDASALARAKLAVHDAMWTPGTAVTRLPVIAEMLDAARASGDDDLAAEAHLFVPRPCSSWASPPDVMSCLPMSPWPASWVMPVAVGEH